MAGMLPGVESARRRRSHGWSDPHPPSASSTRRPSFCLYATQHDTRLTSSSPRQSGGPSDQADNLEGAAMKAKKRLDERFRNQRKLVIGGGCSNAEQPRSGPATAATKKTGCTSCFVREVQLGADGEECPVCLDRFKPLETLVHLDCHHRFHHECLGPWLEGHAECPCCRKHVSSFEFTTPL